MDRAIFGTDGIRGPAGTYPLNEAGARQVGKAVAAHFAQPGDTILVGRDPRQSSPMLEAAVASGLTALGVNVWLVGVIPTPGLAYLTQKLGVPAGVMITASHNPYTDNGIKVFAGSGKKLPDEVEAELNRLMHEDLPETTAGRASKREEVAQDYIDFLMGSVGQTRFDGLRIALDCANGATSSVAQAVFEQLGADATTLFAQPDGMNINKQCGATNTTALQAAVKERSLDVGAAFDGDGDRVVLVDEQGRALNGDHVLYILALTRHEPGVVATVMSNGGLEAALQQHDIALTRTAVGDRYVLEGLEQTGFRLGGEQSGHIIVAELAATGDGLLTALQTLQAVKASGRSLAQWYDELKLWPQALINIPLADKSLLERPEVKAFIAAQTEKLGATGRLNIRASGTEPLARVMVEAPDAAIIAPKLAQQLGDSLADLATQRPADKGSQS